MRSKKKNQRTHRSRTRRSRTRRSRTRRSRTRRSRTRRSRTRRSRTHRYRKKQYHGGTTLYKRKANLDWLLRQIDEAEDDVTQAPAHDSSYRENAESELDDVNRKIIQQEDKYSTEVKLLLDKCRTGYLGKQPYENIVIIDGPNIVDELWDYFNQFKKDKWERPKLKRRIEKKFSKDLGQLIYNKINRISHKLKIFNESKKNTLFIFTFVHNMAYKFYRFISEGWVEFLNGWENILFIFCYQPPKDKFLINWDDKTKKDGTVYKTNRICKYTDFGNADYTHDKCGIDDYLLLVLTVLLKSKNFKHLSYIKG